MAQENLKPVSTRLDPETLRKIDQFVSNRKYWKRNTVINNVLTAIFENFTEGEIYDMVRWWKRGQQEVNAKFEIIQNSPK